jgi:hypothetical protein
MEQRITVTTFVKLDFVDALKCLFGRCLKIETKIDVPQEQTIDRYNAHSITTVERTESHFVKQDKPTFGYVPKS